MRRLGGSVLGAAAVLVLAVGCGQDNDGEGAVEVGGQPEQVESSPIPEEEDPAAADIDPADPVPPSGGSAVAEANVDLSALTPEHPKLVWTEDDGKAVGAYGLGGGCTEVTAEILEETDDKVVLKLVEEVTSDEPCTMEIRYVPATAELDEQLGDRTVVVEREYIGPNG